MKQRVAATPLYQPRKCGAHNHLLATAERHSSGANTEAGMQPSSRLSCRDSATGRLAEGFGATSGRRLTANPSNHHHVKRQEHARLIVSLFHPRMLTLSRGASVKWLRSIVQVGLQDNTRGREYDAGESSKLDHA
jgi:hypothetical protein